MINTLLESIYTYCEMRLDSATHHEYPRRVPCSNATIIHVAHYELPSKSADRLQNRFSDRYPGKLVLTYRFACRGYS